jgi:PTS system nitrogen regulatory IIA component
MANETMDLGQLAEYIRRDQRDVHKLASRGQLPGRRVSGEWRFARAEIDHWLETQLPAYSEEQLHQLEIRDHGKAASEVFVSAMLTAESIAVPTTATTRPSVLRELVRLAEQSHHVYDPDAILEAINQREEMGTTALDSGVALPHPRRPIPFALGDSVVAYARSASGIPFGAACGKLTDIFFLVCCQDQKTHLRVLARLSRLLLRPGFVDDLRSADTPSETWATINAAERALSLS